MTSSNKNPASEEFCCTKLLALSSISAVLSLNVLDLLPKTLFALFFIMPDMALLISLSIASLKVTLSLNSCMPDVLNPT